MEIIETEGFKKDLKTLKRYKSVETDILDLKKVLIYMYEKNEVNLYYKKVGLINNYGGVSLPNGLTACKLTRVHCECLKRDDKIRIVYLLDSLQNKIFFVVIYHHDDNPTQKQEQITKAKLSRFISDSGLFCNRS